MTEKCKQWSHGALWYSCDTREWKGELLTPSVDSAWLTKPLTPVSGQVLTNTSKETDRTPHTDSGIKHLPFRFSVMGTFTPRGGKLLGRPFSSPAHLSCGILLLQFLFNVPLFIQTGSVNTHKCYQKGMDNDLGLWWYTETHTSPMLAKQRGKIQVCRCSNEYTLVTMFQRVKTPAAGHREG